MFGRKSLVLENEFLVKEQQRFMSKVYGWMSMSLFLTGVVAFYIFSNKAILNLVINNSLILFFIFIIELGLVVYLSSMIQRISAFNAVLSLMIYAGLNGIFFALIFALYTYESIATTFLVTAGLFGIMSLYGFFTKSDLSKIGNIAFMALIGIIIASLVNFFFKNSMLYWIITYAGVLIFTALTAYDTQKIKNLYLLSNQDEETSTKTSVMGALTLYLDFINLFIFLLRIMGRARD